VEHRSVQHLDMLGLHSGDPGHCVCNDTHLLVGCWCQPIHCTPASEPADEKDPYVVRVLDVIVLVALVLTVIITAVAVLSTLVLIIGG